MAGLPGSGKSTLAQELALRAGAVVLSKDAIRHVLFAPDQIEYSTAQDDFCQQVMLQTAAYVLKNNPGRVVVLDGRTFSRHYQIENALRAAAEVGQSWRILYCFCSDETARLRLQQQASTGEHPAGNRDFQLYLRVKARFEKITEPNTLIDTDQPLEICVSQSLAAIANPTPHPQ
jgi:adenylylsulfate kinase